MTAADPNPRRRRARAKQRPLNRLTVGQRFTVVNAQGALVIAAAAALGGHPLLAVQVSVGSSQSPSWDSHPES